MRVADYVVQRLYENNCKHIFTVTGRGILFLTDALAKNENVESVHVHHEQAASYSAMAYSQVNGELGAAVVSTGCGSTNAITGLLCAWQDDVPCVFVSGQNKLNETTNYTGLKIKTYGQQEADIIPMVAPITKYATMISDPNEIAYELDKALHLALTGRKGPVWIDIPLDVQNMRVNPEKLRRYVPEADLRPVVKEVDLQNVINLISESRRPVVLIGSGVRSAKAEEELHLFLEKSKIPVVYASSATDIVNSGRVLSLGCVGAMGANRSANFTVQNSDLVLVLGCRLSTMIMGEDVSKFARDAKILTVDIDENEHMKFPQKISKTILADVKDFLGKVLQKELPEVSEVWIDKCRHWKSTFPKCEDRYKKEDIIDIYHFSEIISDYLDERANCVTDAGLTELIIPSTVNFKHTQKSLHPASQGAMGYALPAGVGAYYASKDETIVVVGDGSIMMNIQELQTIAYNKIPIKIFVINNNCYSVIRRRQVDLFRTRTIGTDSENGVSCPDFEKVADCFGLEYEKASTPEELREKLQLILSSNKPILCEVMSPVDQCYIHNSYRRNQKGKFVHLPIEDQSPFIDRDVFLSEMVIDPIDQ